MKSRKWVCSFLALTLAGAPAFAQPPGTRGGGSGSMSASFAKWFGNNTSFSTTAKMTMNGAGKPVTQEMSLAMLDGKMRMDVDLIKGSQMPPKTIERMKLMGMDRMVTIERPDKKVTFQIFPSMQAYSETPFDASRSGSAASDFKMEKTKIGDETIDGHPCVKNKVVITDAKGGKQEGLVWNAKDLRDFPLQMEMQGDDTKINMHFTKISMDKPDAKLFEPPAGFTKYKDQNELLRTEMMKRAGQTPAQKEP